VLTAHYLEKAGTIVGVRAVALLAGLPEDFKSQCYILGRTQVPVPEAWVDMLLPGIFTLQRELRSQVQQASSKRNVDYSALALADTLIMLAQAVLQCMPFRISAYGTSYALLQLPAVRQMVMSPQWAQFSTSILTSHAHMEQLRQAPWQKMIPGLAGTLSQLQGNVQSLTAAVQQQTAAQAQQAAAQAQQEAALAQQARQAAGQEQQAARQEQQVQQVRSSKLHGRSSRCRRSTLPRHLDRCRALRARPKRPAVLPPRSQLGAAAGSRCRCPRSGRRWQPGCCAAACGQSRRHLRGEMCPVWLQHFVAVLSGCSWQSLLKAVAADVCCAAPAS
jgi:hypothetical protein